VYSVGGHFGEPNDTSLSAGHSGEPDEPDEGWHQVERRCKCKQVYVREQAVKSVKTGGQIAKLRKNKVGHEEGWKNPSGSKEFNGPIGLDRVTRLSVKLYSL
jgi:hypothetical protein